MIELDRTVNIITGYQGAGKTAFLTYLAFCFTQDRKNVFKHNLDVQKRKNQDRNKDIILTNVKMDFRPRGRDNLSINNLSDNELKDIFTRKIKICRNSLICLDEGQKLFHAREWRKTDNEAIEFCELARQFDLKIVFTALSLDLLDKVFRGYAKIYHILAVNVYNVYGEKAKTNQTFKDIDIAKIEFKFCVFNHLDEYYSYISSEKKRKSTKVHTEVTYNNLFKFYNNKYRGTYFE